MGTDLCSIRGLRGRTSTRQGGMLIRLRCGVKGGDPPHLPEDDLGTTWDRFDGPRLRQQMNSFRLLRSRLWATEIGQRHHPSTESRDSAVPFPQPQFSIHPASIGVVAFTLGVAAHPWGLYARDRKSTRLNSS